MKKIAKDYFDRCYTPEGIDHDMDPHCETMEELYEWAKKHGYMNYIFELNFVRIMSKKAQKNDKQNRISKTITKGILKL